MVFRQLFFAQFLEPFRVLGGGQDVDEVACFEDGFRIRDHVLSFSLDIDDDGLFQVWYAGERLVSKMEPLAIGTSTMVLCSSAFLSG